MDIFEKQKLIKKVNSSDKATQIWGIIENLKKLRVEHKFTDTELHGVINKLELPFGIHLFITGHFSDLCDCIK